MNHFKIIIFLFFLFFLSNLNGQTSLSVISSNGLKLRSQPDLKSTVLLLIPFQEKIQVSENSTSYPDSVGHYTFHINNLGEVKYHVTGNWVKTSYKGMKGWVFDAYLASLGINEDETSLHESFGFSYIGTDCYYNINRNHDLHWAGLFKKGNMYYIKKTVVNHFTTKGLYGDDLCTTANDNQHLLFLLGSKKDTFQEGEVSGSYFDYPDRGFKYNTLGDEITSNFDFLSGEKLENNKLRLLLKIGEITQVIESGTPNSVIWRGDLDNDGKEDYIIQYGEKSSTTVLYLSSQANKNEIVKPVAAYKSGFCC